MTGTALLWARACATLIAPLMCARRLRQPALRCYCLNSSRPVTRKACPCRASWSLRKNRELFAEQVARAVHPLAPRSVDSVPEIKGQVVALGLGPMSEWGQHFRKSAVAIAGTASQLASQG